jgi:hypothetical protein
MHNCVKYTIIGLLLGVAAVAYGQDDALIYPADNTAMWVDMIRAVGLPGAIAYVGYLFGRGPPMLRFQITLDDDLKEEILKNLKELRKDE